MKMVLGLILLAGVSVTASVLVVQVAVLPLLFKYSKCVQRKMVFANCINYPKNPDYENPSNCNVIGGINFSIEFRSATDGCPIKLAFVNTSINDLIFHLKFQGVWHIVPYTLLPEMYTLRNCECTCTEWLLAELKKTPNPVVMYCHGNSNHRGSIYRLNMYRKLQEMNFHIITFDYRGYGDSTQIRPTERGVVEDALHVYSWLIDSLDGEERPPVIIWGHSLGTAIAANLISNLPTLCKELGKEELPQPDGLVLEAPFNNLQEAVESHPLSKLVSWLPYFKDMFVKPFTASAEYAFTTDQYLAKVADIPILMLHSKGDKIVPYDLAVKLYSAIEESRGDSVGVLEFSSFEKGRGLGHNNLCEAENLQEIVGKFAGS